jgi:hypothetical protein
MLLDNRKRVRRPSRIPAKLVSGGDLSGRDCVVLDISETGARVAINAAQDMPDQFTILFTAGGHPFRRCYVVWRKDAQLGVRFDQTITSHTNPETLHVVHI